MGKVNIHEIRKLELTYRLMFTLRDLNIKAAYPASVDAWMKYITATSHLILNDMPESQ